MKKNYSFSLILFVILFHLSSCETQLEHETLVKKQEDKVLVLTSDQQYINDATQALVKLIHENMGYVAYINHVINDKALPYMEDRVLFADLFKSDYNRMPVAGFSDEALCDKGSFKQAFMQKIEENNEASASGIEASVVASTTLMDFIQNANISVYCPFPLEDYEEGNRIPAIVANINPDLDSQPGVQFYADGSYDTVMVSQEYADLHPVWIIKAEDSYIFDEYNSRNREKFFNEIPENISPIEPTLRIPHYETRINSIYCTEYLGNIFEGDLKIYLCTASTNPQYNEEKECFTGSFDYIFPVTLPRKYVANAKKGYDKGWYTVYFVFDTDWKINKYQNYFAAYEYDPKMEVMTTFGTTYKYNLGVNPGIGGQKSIITGGITKEQKAEITLKYSSKNDLMGLARWDRDWFFNVISNSGVTWTDDEGNVLNTAIDGLHIIKTSSFFYMSIANRTYYTYIND